MSKWTKEEELCLIKDVANGLQIEHIAMKRNRSNSAIELRLKKIIFENIVAGRSVETMAQKLHLSVDKINQYFFAYKDFKDKHSSNANNLDIYADKKKSDNPMFSKLHKEIEDLKDNISDKNNLNVQHGGLKLGNLENKIKKLELENKLIHLIVENKELNSQLNKLIKEGKVDKNVKTVLKNLREKQI